MCGIAGVYLRDPQFECDLNAITTTLIDEIDIRGKHACGFVAIGDDGVLEWQKAAVSATKFNLHRKPVPEGSQLVLAHTRWATQGDPGFMENNHPIKRGPFFIIHNGHVVNDHELFRNAERKRYGQVDSEAIAARLSSFGSLSDLEKVMAEIRGGAAVAAVDERDCRRLAIAKGSSNPIWVYSNERIVIFASTRYAVTKTYSKHIGKVGDANLVELDEGDAWEWHDRTLIKRSFEVRKHYTSYSWHEDESGTRVASVGRIWNSKEKRWKVWDSKEGKYVPEATTTPTTTASKDGKKGKKKGSDKPWSVSRPALPAPRNQIIAADQEYFDCEHCGESMHWSAVNYFRLPAERVTFLVCELCFDYLAKLDEEGLDAFGSPSNDFAERGMLFDEDGFPIDPDDPDGPIDDFEGANRRILRNFLGWV